jgi:hypothetical protein
VLFTAYLITISKHLITASVFGFPAVFVLQLVTYEKALHAVYTSKQYTLLFQISIFVAWYSLNFCLHYCVGVLPNKLQHLTFVR